MVMNTFLSERFPRKISKLLGVLTKKNYRLTQTLHYQFLWMIAERTSYINRTHEEDLLIKRYWFDGLTYHPTKDAFQRLK